MKERFYGLKGKKKRKRERKRKFYTKATNSFSYRVQVPGQIDEKRDLEATYKDGVMKVSFTKLKEEQPKKIAIKIV